MEYSRGGRQKLMNLLYIFKIPVFSELLDVRNVKESTELVLSTMKIGFSSLRSWLLFIRDTR